jgi:hypothetical protein
MFGWFMSAAEKTQSITDRLRQGGIANDILNLYQVNNVSFSARQEGATYKPSIYFDMPITEAGVVGGHTVVSGRWRAEHQLGPEAEVGFLRRVFFRHNQLPEPITIALKNNTITKLMIWRLINKGMLIEINKTQTGDQGREQFRRVEGYGIFEYRADAKSDKLLSIHHSRGRVFFQSKADYEKAIRDLWVHLDSRQRNLRHYQQHTGLLNLNSDALMQQIRHQAVNNRL